MKIYLLMLALIVISQTTLAASSDCEIKVRASIPKNLNLGNLKLELYSQEVPIHSYELETCTSYKELSVSKRHFSRSNIGIIGKYEGGTAYLFSALVHRQAKIIDLNAITTIANQACPNQCGYYEYERLKNDSDIQTLALQYSEKISKQNAKTKQSEAAKAYVTFSKQAQNRYAQLLPVAPNLPHFQKGEAYLSDPYSGTYNFFPKEPSITEVFETLFDPKKDAYFKKVDKKEFRKKSKPLKSLAREMYSSRYQWDKFLVKSKALSQAMRATNEPILIEYVDMVDDIIIQATLQHKAEIARIRTLSGTPFSHLNQRDISFGDLMGYWSYIAYHQAELNEKEAFSTLFSQHYLQSTAPYLLQKNDADKSVSYLVAMFNLLFGGNDEHKMKRIKGEFDNTAKLNGERYNLKDGFIDLAFVYEKGAWRLDYMHLSFL